MISERPQSVHQAEFEADKADKAGEPRLYRLLRAAARENVSDLHLQAGSVPYVRVRTQVLPVRGSVITAEEMLEMVREVLTSRQMDVFQETGSIDMARQPEGSDRFRINIFRQRGQISIAVRRVTREIPTFEQLNLPASIARIARYEAGLVLVAGVTGSGKSTTIAAALEAVNQNRRCHVVTIEDPIEFLYTNKKALVNQREIGTDVPDFATALKYLMREDPDVVLIGEMRDPETFQAALSAAETGHLVFGTIHASNSASTVGRILDMYPPDSRDLVRQSLGFNLQAIVVQKLLPCLRPEIERVPATEMLFVNPVARKMISQGRDAELLDVVRAGEQEGMQDFNRSLLELVENEYVEPKVAFGASPNPDELKMMLKGISTSRVALKR